MEEWCLGLLVIAIVVTGMMGGLMDLFFNAAIFIFIFLSGIQFAAPLYREEGFMMAVNTLKENDGAAGFATIWADYLLANKDKILGIKK